MSESTFNFKSTKDKKTGTHHIVLKGDMSIRNAVNIKKKMNAAILTGDNIMIRVCDVDNMDLTFIQLLSSFKNSLTDQGKIVEIKTELPENTEKLIRNSGVNKLINTTLK